MKSITFVATILLGSLCILSCSYADSSSEKQLPDIAGKIMGISYASDEEKRHGRLCTLMVVGRELDGIEDKAIVTITDKTYILIQGKHQAGLEVLKEGVLVEVQFTGPVMMSHPVMATAREIRIVDQSGGQ